jgi:four helix bundle protein
MPEYKREIKSWTIKFSVSIVRLVKELEVRGVAFSILNQLLRAGTSIGANVHEGRSSSSEKELHRYLRIALKSANETDYWLNVISQAYPDDVPALNECRKELVELQKVLATIVIKLKNKTIKATKKDNHQKHAASY